MLLGLVTVTPTAAWRSASPHARHSRRHGRRPCPDRRRCRAPWSCSPRVSRRRRRPAHPSSHRRDALAAGGRRAPGGKVVHGRPLRHRCVALAGQGRLGPGRPLRTCPVRDGQGDRGHLDGRPDLPAQPRPGPSAPACWFTAYHYANPSRERGDARREADFFLEHADLRGANLLPALDLEETGDLTPGAAGALDAPVDAPRASSAWAWPRCSTPAPASGRAGWTTRASVARAGFATLWLSHWQVRKPWIPARRVERPRLDVLAVDRARRGARASTGYVDRNVYSGPKLQRMTIRAAAARGVAPERSARRAPAAPTPALSRRSGGGRCRGGASGDQPRRSPDRRRTAVRPGVMRSPGRAAGIA